MKHLVFAFLALVVLGVAAAPVRASDFCLSEDFRRWRDEQEVAATAFVRQFVKSGDPVKTLPGLLGLVRVEGRLLICVPPLRPSEFFTLGLQDADPAGATVHVFRKFLAREGIHLDPARLFEGRTFDFSDER
ncbi:MAG: hypothetical protein HY727_21635 [Candidatus Rokubacteria bacterium]|nr:hypothetical protein [Candidatus Rokubacteria bacterium]